MNTPIFCQTRHEYGSYKYYFDLVRLSGYPVIYVDEIDPTSDNTYIVSMLNGEWQHGWQNPRARIIWWDLEWRLDNYFIPDGVADVWASDRWYASETGARYVPLGSHPDLTTWDTPVPKIEYDVAFICAMNGRRYFIEGEFKREGLRLMPNDWVVARDTWLKQTRLMVHTHQWDTVKAISPLRAAVAAAYKMPLLAEVSQDAGILGTAIAQAETTLLAEMAAGILKNAPLLRNMADRLHNLLCVDNTFASFVEAAL